MKKILIIEDDPDITALTKFILEKEGLDVKTFSDFIGYEDILNKVGADLVLLDLNIHGYSGKVICDYIKTKPHLKQTRVILMSANTDIEAVQEAAGADAFVSKPFDLDHLINMVKQHLNYKAIHQA